ncbi:hypothetical protein LCGC14_0547780 [marine sediment metagenome]|uniref:GIY-YIG domain-containing protein n=1 Tax=marine sediment metagenome TaxID=412755 RepID=A0A0F9UC96_9ZZZZ
MSFFVYILTCKNKKGKYSFYTGYTNDVPRRLKEHKSGRGAIYTRNKEVHFSAAYEYPTRSLAMSREKQIKKLSHDQKARLLYKNPITFGNK